MYVISLVFFGFAVRKYQDRYIPASLSMVLWFLLGAVCSRPTEATLAHLELLSALEKLVFTVMIVLLLALCVLRRKPFAIDWIPLAGTVLAAAIRLGWFGYYHWTLGRMGEDPFGGVQRMAVISGWKDFALQLILSAVAVWHIYWLSRPRFIK